MTWPAMSPLTSAPTDGTRILLAWEHLPHPVVGYYGKHGHAANRWMAQVAPNQSAMRPRSPPLGWWPLPALTKPAALPKEGEEAIRARAFEEAAKVAEDHLSPVLRNAADCGTAYNHACREIAAAVRALSSLPVRSGEVERLVADWPEPYEYMTKADFNALPTTMRGFIDAYRSWRERLRAGLAPPPQAQVE